MAEAAKWALLGVAAVLIIAMVLGLPILAAVSDSAGFMLAFVTVGNIIRSVTVPARALINLFLTDWGINLFTVVISYLILKPVLTYPIKLILVIYHWIFKG